jgi:hypothetical protein
MNAVVIDEDLQIVRATLVAVGDELSQWSPEAGRALERAVRNLDVARQEFSQSRDGLSVFNSDSPA